MSIRRHSPSGASQPTGTYSSVAVVPPGRALVWISGQTGRLDNGALATDIGEQVAVALDNIERAIRQIGLSPLDIVHLRTYLVGRDGLSEFKRTRDFVFEGWLDGAAPPTSTVLIVSGLADPEAVVEIEAVVAGAPEDNA